jgi:hypothetical protein
MHVQAQFEITWLVNRLRIGRPTSVTAQSVAPLGLMLC